MATTLPLFLDLWVKGLTWTQWGPLLYVKLKLGSKLMMLRSEETCPPFFSTGFIWEHWSEEDDQLFPDCGLVVWVPYQHVQGPQPCDRWGKLEKDPGSRNFEGPQTYFTWDHLRSSCSHSLLGKEVLSLWVRKKNHQQYRRLGFNPWVRKIPCRRKWQPTPVSLTEKNLMNRGVWWATVHAVQKTRTRLSNYSLTRTHSHIYRN